MPDHEAELIARNDDDTEGSQVEGARTEGGSRQGSWSDAAARRETRGGPCDGTEERAATVQVQEDRHAGWCRVEQRSHLDAHEVTADAGREHLAGALLQGNAQVARGDQVRLVEADGARARHLGRAQTHDGTESQHEAATAPPQDGGSTARGTSVPADLCSARGSEVRHCGVSWLGSDAFHPLGTGWPDGSEASGWAAIACLGDERPPTASASASRDPVWRRLTSAGVSAASAASTNKASRSARTSCVRM